MLYPDETYNINGALFTVHKTLGPGLLEKVYQEALEIEFQRRLIPYEREKAFEIKYMGKTLSQKYVADFVCYGKIIVELKATDAITDLHKAQVINYLNITGYKLGLLQNMNVNDMKPAIRLFGKNATNF